jgi:hypothetical protein
VLSWHSHRYSLPTFSTFRSRRRTLPVAPVHPQRWQAPRRSMRTRPLFNHAHPAQVLGSVLTTSVLSAALRKNCRARLLAIVMDTPSDSWSPKPVLATVRVIRLRIPRSGAN